MSYVCFIPNVGIRFPVQTSASFSFTSSLSGSDFSRYLTMRGKSQKKISKFRSARKIESKSHAPSSSRVISMALGVAVLVAFSAVLVISIKARVPFRLTKVSNSISRTTGVAPVYQLSIVKDYPHDKDAFTQGLLVGPDGYLYESTGLYGQSTLRQVDLNTGLTVDSHKLLDDEFGEGLTLSSENDAHLVQVLWKTGRGYVYDRATLQRLASFQLPGDAWGITQIRSGSNELVLSDGTSTLQVLSVDVHGIVKYVRTISVNDGGKPVGLLNELEMVHGELWANIFMADVIARIDIDTGVVNSWIDCRNLLDSSKIPPGHRVDVLNGIAHDPKSDVVYITGKLWPRLFAVRVINEQVAESVADIVNAFFLDPKRVAYIHKHMLA